MKPNGFVLIITLVFLLVLSLLVVPLQNEAILQWKLVQSVQHRHRLFVATEKALQWLEAHCYERVSDDNKITIDNAEYHYAVSAIHRDPCIKLPNDKRPQIAQYYRVSVCRPDGDNAPLRLESVFAKLIGVSQCPKAKWHSARLGRQSWRQLGLEPL